MIFEMKYFEKNTYINNYLSNELYNNIINK